MERDRSIAMDLDVGVYAPAEDTFLMLSAIEVQRGERVLEMGCGSGYLSVHMAKAGASVTAVDIDPLAVSNARRSAELNHILIETKVCDLFDGIDGRFDLIVFNPPYLRGLTEGQEDLCWAGGENGVELTSRFLDGAKDHLMPGGRVLIIVSDDADEKGLKRALLGWSVRGTASKHLFFERLDVLELTL